jgi:putative Mn2+ efflux pump MntP
LAIGDITIVLIAVGLAMDAVAVSIASGMVVRPMRIGYALRTAAFFGGFQAGMPIIGWSGGLALSYLISGVDHWIAFGLLTFIGCRMIYESRKVGSKEVKPLNLHTLLILSVATSIDALGVGITFPFVEISIFTAVAIIGAVTFALSFVAVYVGNRMGHMFESVVEAAGGLVLIAIGARMLLENFL